MVASRRGHPNQMTLSIPPDQQKALRLFAVRDGHDFVSRALQDLIVKEAQRRFGDEWRKQVREWAHEQEAMAG